MTNNLTKFNTCNFENKNNLSFLRWTVDVESDLEFIRKIYEKMKPDYIFSTNQVLDIIKQFPELVQINKGILRNEGWKSSFDLDKQVKKFSS